MKRCRHHLCNIRVLSALLAVLSFQLQALPETCFQNPQRIEQCPRIIYKNARLPDPESGKEKKQLVCICLTDFEDLLVQEDTELEQQVKELRIKTWSAQLGITEEKLKELVKY